MTRVFDWLERTFRSGESGRNHILLFFALLVAGFYIDKLLFGPFAAVRLHDVFDSDFFRYRALASYGPLAQWYPNYAGGMPAYAWHHTPFYLLSLLAAVLPLWLIYSSVVLLLMLCAGWGMFRLLEEHAGLSRPAAAWGGTFFALLSQVQQNSIPSTVFNYAFPLFFCWFVDACRARRDLRRLLPPLAGINALLALSYPVLTLPYFPLVQLLLLVVFSGKDGSLAGERRGLLAWYFVLWTGYVLACVPVLYSLLNFIPLACKRGEFPALTAIGPAITAFLKTSGLMLLASTSRAALIVPLAAGLGLAGRCPRLRVYYAALAAVALISGFYSSEISAILRGSLLLKMDLGHFFWTLPFLGALAAATAAGCLFRGERSGAAFEMSLLGFAALFVCSITGLIHRSTIAPNVLSGALFLLLIEADRVEGMKASPAAAWGVLLAGLAAAVWSCKIGEQIYLPALLFLAAAAWTASAASHLAVPGRRALYWAVLLAVIFAASARFARNKGEEPEADRYIQVAGYSSLKQFRNDADPSRVASFGISPFSAISQGLETADARGPVFSGRYKDYVKLILLPQLADKKREDFFDSYWYNLFFYEYVPSAGLNFGLARAANIRYVIAPEPSELLRAQSEEVTAVRSDIDLALGRFRPVLEKSRAGRKLLNRYFSELYVYRLKGSFPRAFLVPGKKCFSGGQELLSALAQAGEADLASAAYLESGEGSQYAAQPRPGRHDAGMGKIRGASYSPDRAVYAIEPPRPGLLVFNVNYHPGWRASVNGSPVKVLHANYAFMAVPVPAGKAEVVFEFHTPQLALLWAGALAGALFINSLLAVAYSAGQRSGG